MNAVLLASSSDLIEEAAARIGGEGPDLSDRLVVFPGKRPAHFLRKRLSRGREGGFIPPHILAMDELIDSLYDARAGEPAPALEDIDAVAVLHEIQLSSSSPIGGAGFMTMDSFFPLGLKIYKDLEELLIEGAAPRRVREVQPLIEGEVPPRSRERLAELARFYEEFYPAVERLGFSTRSSRYRAVCDTVEQRELDGYKRILFAGFHALTTAERSLFARVGSWPCAELLFQDGPGMREKLDALGIRHAAVGPKERPPSPDVRFYSSPDAHGQVFALSAALSKAGEGSAVVLPVPETLFPLLRHGLSRFPEESYNVSLGYPLDRTPLYGFFADLMQVVGSMDGERVYLPDYLTFVLHPYTKNIRFQGSAEATRVLFHGMEDRMAASRTRSFATLEEIESDGGLFKSTAESIQAENAQSTAKDLAAHLRLIHERTIRRFRAFASVKEFARRCVELIVWVHESSTAPEHPLFSRFSEEFIRSLEAISRSLMAGKSFADTAGYFILFRRYIRTRYYPFPGTPLRGLQVLGGLETRCLRFDRVFVLDANEGSFPASGAEDTLLPFAVRKSLGLSTYRERDEAAAYRFELLARGARELHLFYVEGGERERSRFVEKLLWEKQKAENVLDETGLVRPIRYAVSLENRPPAPIAKTVEMVERLRAMKYSATTLDSYLRCPLSFYYANVLGLGRREETTGEIEQADIGLFVHEALFRYFTPRKGRVLTGEDADPAAMDSVVERLFKERYGDGEAGSNRLLKNQIRSHMRDFIKDYFHPLVTGHRIRLIELEHGVSVAREGFILTGRMDVVEERDGETRIVDYKTGWNPASYRIRLDGLQPEDRETWRAAIPTVQLPFYLMLESHANAMFLLLGRSVLNEGIEVPLFSDAAEGKRELPRLEKVIFALLREISSIVVPFTPSVDRKKTCAYCDFTTLCGIK